MKSKSDVTPICQLYSGGKGEDEFKALLHAMSAYAEQIFISARLD